jgi:hypothetical protein
MSNTCNVNDAVLNASFLISNHIAKTKKPFTTGENLIMPCLADACKTILDKKVENKMTQIPLSNDMIVRHITMMNEDLHQQLLEKARKSKNCFSSIG